MNPVRTVARALLAAVFVRGGLDAYNNPDRFADTAAKVTERLGSTLEAVGLPTDPRALARTTGIVQMVGGVMLATNTFTRPVALALAASLVPSTVAGQDLWSEAEPGGQPIDRPEVLKNLGLMGGLLLAAVDTEGKPGLAWRTSHLAEHAQDSVKRAAHTTTKETKRAAQLTAKEARRAAQDAQRTAHTAARDAKQAVKSTAGGLLPG
ncbi:DoxX family membrane protein [Planosporangium flavigriseum]|nr:DoxX family protein [Planosporangium flavigriseum]NJC64512.1 DoxX family membrane protein [Planosporangium flavigriseum]